MIVPKGIPDVDFGGRRTFDERDTCYEMFTHAHGGAMHEGWVGRISKQRAFEGLVVEIRRIPRLDDDIRAMRRCAGHTAQIVARRGNGVIGFPVPEPRFRGKWNPGKAAGMCPSGNSFSFE